MVCSQETLSQYELCDAAFKLVEQTDLHIPSEVISEVADAVEAADKVQSWLDRSRLEKPIRQKNIMSLFKILTY